ncbi:MAG: chorismate-binding protein, partial [Candidatus Zixiibacteriota bacterium]
MGELATVVGPQVASLRQAPSGVFEPHACEPGALLLAYGRGKMSVLATDPVDKFELSAHQRLPENWAERLDRFIGDGSRFCSLFFSYDFGAELVRGPNCYTISSNGIPRVLAYKYDRAQIIESDPQVKSRLDAVTLGQPPAGLELRRPDRGDYMRDVRRIKEHIREGDIYQANLTGQWEVESTASPWDVYLRLRDLNRDGICELIVAN